MVPGVRRVRMFEVVDVAAIVVTERTSGELVPTPRLSVNVVRATVVPESVKPEVLLSFASVPQVIFPDVSAFRSQLAALSVLIVNPPDEITRPERVDEAVVPSNRGAATPPPNVDVAVVDVALKNGASM